MRGYIATENITTRDFYSIEIPDNIKTAEQLKEWYKKTYPYQNKRVYVIISEEKLNKAKTKYPSFVKIEDIIFANGITVYDNTEYSHR